MGSRGCWREEAVSDRLSEPVKEKSKDAQQESEEDQPPAADHALTTHPEESQFSSRTDRADAYPQAQDQSQNGEDQSSLDGGMNIE